LCERKEIENHQIVLFPVTSDFIFCFEENQWKMTSKHIVCKNFGSAAGCKFGDKCHFLHKTTAKRTPVPTIPRPAPRNTVLSSAQMESSTLLAQPHPPAPAVGSEGFNSSAMWGLDSNDDGVYYYGAPGSNNSWNNTDRASFPLYSAVAKLHISEEATTIVENEAAAQRAEQQPKQICSFFLSGNCKFGDRCKNLHLLDHPISTSNIENEEGDQYLSSDQTITAVSQNRECGICIEPAETALFGLLSHCECRFCLECIREWRKEGLVVAKKADQVRYVVHFYSRLSIRDVFLSLCPLCRTESYFVVPSSTYLVGEAKEIFLKTYKDSLGAKPCKVSALSGLSVSICFFIYFRPFLL
jgi:hypothetical protein